MTDEELIEKYYGCSEEAFEELRRRHEAHVVAFLRAMKTRVDLVDDSAQETWIKIFKSKDKVIQGKPGPGAFRGGSFEKFLARVAKNAARDALRRRLRVERRETGVDNPEDCLRPGVRGSPAASFELSELLQHVLAKLPQRERHVFVLYYLEGLTLPETAEVLGCSVGTAYARLVNARAQARVVLGKEMDLDA